jgi:hypothetical protein
VLTINGVLQELVGENIDEQIAMFITDDNCRDDFVKSIETIRGSFGAVANII